MAMVKTKTSKASSAPVRQVRRTDGRCAEAGYTLLEMLIVVAVLAVVMSSVRLLPQSRAGSVDVAAATQLIASSLRQARNTSIRRRAIQHVYFDVNRRTVWTDSGRNRLALDRRIRMAISSARSQMRSDSVAQVRFYPNGSSSGGKVVLEGRSGAREIRINWHTGRISTSSLQ
ncbi:MAG: GspH/FimT family protein [Hyphomicrobiaceae bacterium]